MMKSNIIFVFGSNTAGIHGAGAAREAYTNHGAAYNRSYGHVGNSFAIPTKGHIPKPRMAEPDRAVVGPTLDLHWIGQYIAGFLAYAQHHPELVFKVTRLGCGLAGLKDEDIAPMFTQASKNCFFDEAWKPYLERYGYEFWGTY